MAVRWGVVLAAALAGAAAARTATPDGEGAPQTVRAEFSICRLQGWSFAEMQVIPEVRRAQDADLWFEDGGGNGTGAGPTASKLTAPGGILSLSDVVPIDPLAPRAVHLFEAVLGADPKALTLHASAASDVRSPETEVFILRTRKGGWARLVVADRHPGRFGSKTATVTLRATFNPREPRFAPMRPDATRINGVDLAPAATPRTLAPPAGGALGGEEAPLSTLDDAKILARTGVFVGAASRFGDAASEAQGAGDLVAEIEVADAFSRFVSFESMAAVLPNTDDSVVRATRFRASLLAAAMRHLDASRCGAFVSAPVLARYVLQHATETGDFAHVEAAAQVALFHMSLSGSGKGTAVTARYAEGMLAVSAGRSADAARPLLAAFTEATAEDWFDLAVHAGTELAAARWQAGDEDGAKRALRDVADSFASGERQSFFGPWVRIVRTRFPDAEHPLRRLLADFTANAARYGASRSEYGGEGPGTMIAAGGRGGRGGKSALDISEIGRILPHVAATTSVVSVARGSEGFRIRWGTTPADRTERAADDRVTSADEGGVTLTFQGSSVALRTVDVTGRAGLPGRSVLPSHPDPSRAFYLLARGETWSVAKDGTVTIHPR